MKINITKKWKRFLYSTTSIAIINGGELRCSNVSWLSMYTPSWQGDVRIGCFKINGPIRRSEQKAQQDAEQLAIELLRDIRDGAKELVRKCGMGEDD